MALVSSVKNVVENAKSTSSLVLINHFDRVVSDNTVNLDVSIPGMGLNLTYAITDEKFNEGMQNGGFDGVALIIVEELRKSLDILIGAMKPQVESN